MTKTHQCKLFFTRHSVGVLNYTHYSKQRGSECNILHKHKNLQTHRDCPLTWVSAEWQHLPCVFVVRGLGSVRCALPHDSTLRLFVRVWDWLQGVYKGERVGMLFFIVMAINEDVCTVCWWGSDVCVYVCVCVWIVLASKSVCLFIAVDVNSAVHLWTRARPLCVCARAEVQMWGLACWRHPT